MPKPFQVAKWLLGEGNTPIYRGNYPSNCFINILKYPEWNVKKKESQLIEILQRNLCWVHQLRSNCVNTAVGPRQEWPVSRLGPLECEPTQDTQDQLKNDDKFHLENPQLLHSLVVPRMDWMDYTSPTLPGNDHMSHLKSLWSLKPSISTSPLPRQNPSFPKPGQSNVALIFFLAV